MHEFSIVSCLLNELENISKSNQGRKILKVNLRVGALEHIEPEVLKSIFDQAKADSCAEFAELIINIEEALVKCRVCESEYIPEDDIWICSRCGAIGGEIVRGTDIIIESVYLEDTSF